MPRFVILEHTWRGVHWDLMFEPPHGERLLRTWAIDEPLAYSRAVLARALGDHRPTYLDYEGPISGDRGHVHCVDAGTYVARMWTENDVVLEITGRIWRGCLAVSRDNAGHWELFLEPAPD
jgi:hypothetical protein